MNKSNRSTILKECGICGVGETSMITFERFAERCYDGWEVITNGLSLVGKYLAYHYWRMPLICLAFILGYSLNLLI